MTKSIPRIINKLYHFYINKFAAISKLSKRDFNESFISVLNNRSGNVIKMFLRKDSYMEKEFLNHGLYGNWEKESLKIWAELSLNANHILDIGANTGVYSLIAQSQNRSANIYAAEPVDINFKILFMNIKENNFNIHAEKIALSDKDGTATMHMLKDQLNYMTSVNDNRYEKHPEIQGDKEVIEITVQIKSYAFLEQKFNIPKVDLVKIDTEGHEVEVIKGMLEMIDRDKPIILLEIIGDQNAKFIEDFFLPRGYKFISINEISKSVVVKNLWDNDHHNFLLCDEETVKLLRIKSLVE